MPAQPPSRKIARIEPALPDLRPEDQKMIRILEEVVAVVDGVNHAAPWPQHTFQRCEQAVHVDDMFKHGV